jgi:hypothetical protein
MGFSLLALRAARRATSAAAKVKPHALLNACGIAGPRLMCPARFLFRIKTIISTCPLWSTRLRRASGAAKYRLTPWYTAPRREHMAKVTSGPMGATDARNKIGAVVFTRVRGSMVVRALVTPANPNTGSQQAVRAALRQLTVNWQTVLTPAQRTAWNVYASNQPTTDKLGQAMHLSGYTKYIQTNADLQRIYGRSANDPPPAADPLQLTSFTAGPLDNVAHTFPLAWTPALDANHALLAYATQDQNPSTTQPHHQPFFINAFDGTGLAAADIFTAYTTKFPQLTEPRLIISTARLMNLTTGQLSRPLRSDSLSQGATDLLLSATVTLTNAQLKNLRAAPITIVAAPGANKLLCPISLAISTRGNTVSWTLASTNVSGFIGPTANNLNFGGGTFFNILNIAAPTDGDGCETQNLNTWGSNANAINQPLTIGNSGANDLTSGTGTMTVTIFYAVATVPAP